MKRPPTQKHHHSHYTEGVLTVKHNVSELQFACLATARLRKPIVSAWPDLRRAFNWLANKSYEETLTEFGMFSLEKQILRGDIMVPFKYLQDCHIEKGKDLFSAATQEQISNANYYQGQRGVLPC